MCSLHNVHRYGKRHVHAQELQAPDVGHLVPPAATANFGVTAVAAIHEPVADAAAEPARLLTCSSGLLPSPAEDAVTADCERLGASVYQTPSNDSAVDVEGLPAAPPAAVLPPDAQLATTAGSPPQHTVPAAGSEPQRPMVRGALHVVAARSWLRALTHCRHCSMHAVFTSIMNDGVGSPLVISHHSDH
jgi:hypothetical protein